MNNLEKEINSFSHLWKGGFRNGLSINQEADPVCDYKMLYQKIIQPYISKNKRCLEIGCGNGFWSEVLVGFGEYVAFDALSAGHNKFWNRIKKEDWISYFQVKDFRCDELEDNSIDYVFSYDVFCHISYSGAQEYLKNLSSKLKNGADLFIMIADEAKYKDDVGLRKLMEHAGHKDLGSFMSDIDGDSSKTPGRWFFYGAEKFINFARKCGYTLVDKDAALNIDKLSPVIHLKK